MSNKERQSYFQSLRKGLELAEYRMLRDKAMRNLTIVQGDGAVGVREVSARQVFKEIYKEDAPAF